MLKMFLYKRIYKALKSMLIKEVIVNVRNDNLKLFLVQEGFHSSSCPGPDGTKCSKIISS